MKCFCFVEVALKKGVGRSRFDWKRVAPAEPVDPNDANVRSAKVLDLLKEKITYIF